MFNMKHSFYIELENRKPIELTKTKAIRVGRGTATTPNFLAIDDQTVSANHCMIAVKDSKIPSFWVWDLASKNKTIVNGIRKLDGSSDVEVDRACQVYHGDFILIGNCKIIFLISRDSSNLNETL